jgi:hypothetical protein
VVVLLNVPCGDLVVVRNHSNGVAYSETLGKITLTLSLASIVESGHVEGSVAAGLSFFFLTCDDAFAGRSVF